MKWGLDSRRVKVTAFSRVVMLQREWPAKGHFKDVIT